MNTGMTVRPPVKVDAPASDELQRAEFLMGRLHSAISRTERMNLAKVTLDREHAEELLQLLADSIKTAKQLARR